MANTEHILFKMHSHFQEAEQLWKNEFTLLADHLNEQQRVLSHTLAYKLISSCTFGDLINSCAKAHINKVVTEKLEMVKYDYPDVNVAQSKYGYKAEANDRVDKDLA